MKCRFVFFIIIWASVACTKHGSTLPPITGRAIFISEGTWLLKQEDTIRYDSASVMIDSQWTTLISDCRAQETLVFKKDYTLVQLLTCGVGGTAIEPGYWSIYHDSTLEYNYGPEGPRATLFEGDFYVEKATTDSLVLAEHTFGYLPPGSYNAYPAIVTFRYSH